MFYTETKLTIFLSISLNQAFRITNITKNKHTNRPQSQHYSKTFETKPNFKDVTTSSLTFAFNLTHINVSKL